MGKKLTIAAVLVAVFLLFLSSSISLGEITKLKISEAMEREHLPPVASSPEPTATAVPLKPGLTLDSPGEMIGTTHYDYQTNGSTGTRVVKDYLGGLHFTWTNGVDYWTGNRWVYYNFLDESGIWAWPEVGTQVNSTQGAGYPQVDVLSDGRAAIVYDPFTLAIDSLRGLGRFTEIPGPEPGAWPYQAIDRADRIHVVYYMNGGPYSLKYTRYEDGGWTQPQLVDSLVFVSAVITTSNISDRVAIVYTTGDPDDPTQIVDVFYIESEDGTNWNWSEKTNITNYQPQDAIRAFTDLDAVYDLDDNLHIVWNTPYYYEMGYLSSDACLLWHWSQPTGITFLADGWWTSSPGAWNLSISKMSIGVGANNHLYSVWTQFTEEDKSVCGWSNGELFMSDSYDKGLRWGTPINLTHSPSPDCWPGECDSDHWSSLAEQNDGDLHIVYINDKDAGGIPQTEGVDTENPVLYYHLGGPAVDDKARMEPAAFALMQNYPNPFNATTEITYHLEMDATVELEVFNLLGEKVETLIDAYQSAGQRAVIWDASDFTSGIYFCRLRAGDSTQIRRMTLLR
jgi:hypothetical protein